MICDFDPIHMKWNAVSLPKITGPATRLATGMISVPTSLGPMRIGLHDYGVRIKLGADRRIDYGLLSDITEVSGIEIVRENERLLLHSDRFTLEIESDGLAIALRAGNGTVLKSATDGHFVRRYRLPPFAAVGGGWVAHFDLESGEPVYGLGEKWGPLNKRGQLIHSYNHDALGVNAEASYKNAPFAWSPNGWAVLCHTPSPVLHGVGFPNWSQRSYGVFVDDPSFDLFILHGDTGAEILDRYTALTGRSPIPPKWSLGVILSKAYYRTSEEFLNTAREVRRRGMPCDTISLDGRAWLDTDTRFSFEWDNKRYPDPTAVLNEAKRLNFKICIWEYPLISVHNPLFKDLSDRGWLLKHEQTGESYIYEWEKEPFGDVLSPLPDSGILDFTHPDAYAYWRDRHQELFSIGIDMIKADFGEQVPDGVVAHNGERGRALHNVYAFLYNKCVYEAAEKYSASGPFLFSRASWIGCQKFPSQWGGDPQADWEGLAASIRGGLSWGLTGAPYYATDVGGFYGDQRNPRLYVRWLQAAIFAAHLRLHGIGEREPWSYGAEAERAAMEALRWRYRLLPYTEQVIAQSSATGLPVQRAMVIACPDEREAWSFDEQFFFGDHMLVAPCIREDNVVRAYLPEGQWRRFPDGQAFEGGRMHRLTLALEEMAVFVREGVSIPLGPDCDFIADG